MSVASSEARGDAPHPAATAPVGLSARTQHLWLAAVRYRRLADDLAVADAQRLTL